MSSSCSAPPGCPRQATLPFLTGTEPTRICPVHGGLFAAAAAAAGLSPIGPAASGTPVAAASDGAPTEPRPATDNVFGAVGNFFGALFGKH
jgi:hypothetical protein